MKISSIIGALLIISTISFSQTFNGVPISGQLSTAIAKLKVKGFTVKQQYPDGAIMQGMVASNSVKLYIYTTPISHQVFKMVVCLDADENWSSLKYNYNKFVGIFTEKYGARKDKVEYFTSPYYEGDGYETTALSSGNCTYFSFWKNVDNMNLAVEINKYTEIRLSYENEVLINVYSKETKKIENDSF